MVSARLVLLTLLVLGAASDGKKEFEDAAALFRVGKFEDALPYFERAYAHSSHRPSTIRGLAQCERALKLYDRAIQHFAEYVSVAPEAEDLAAIEETIHLLEKEKRQAAAVPGAPERTVETPPVAPSKPAPKLLAEAPGESPKIADVTPPPAEPSSDLLSSPFLWIGVGVAAVAVGIATAVLLASRSPDYDRGNSGVLLHP
jgi:tetratricopeptide (TPR) repeat protein